MAEQDYSRSVRLAVEYRDPEAVRAAVAARRGIEDRNEIGATPLLTAVGSNQYVIAEILVDGGADIWAVSDFGVAVGHLIQAGALPPGGPEGDARQRVIVKLKARGYPFPPPPQDEVRRLVAEGRWPPRAG